MGAWPPVTLASGCPSLAAASRDRHSKYNHAIEKYNGGLAMIDHIGVAVSDVAKSKAFFQAALAPLGYKVVMDFGEAAGLGADGKPDFWIASGKPAATSHIAIVAANRAAVKAFYDAAIAAGGRDNGA